MPIKFNCHKCGANLRVPEQHIGKKARCPKCDEKCVVPSVSQRDSSVSGSFEDAGLLSQPMAASAGLPVGQSVSEFPPPMATPVGIPQLAPSALPSSIPPVAASPYAAPLNQTKRHGGGGEPISGSVVQPLYEARTYIKIFGWAMFLVGILQFIIAILQAFALTFGAAANVRGGPGGAEIVFLLIIAMVGFIVPIVMTYLGWQIKSAGGNLTTGVETGSKERVRTACQQLANYFRIMGILALLGLLLMAIFFMFMLVGVGAAFAA